MSAQQILRSRDNQFPNLPDRWREERIYDVAELRTSSVDKKSEEGEKPVKLCNYVDVYYNDSITAAINFMEATATEAQVERFTLKVGDVVITKDSESPDDIGVPSVVTEPIADLVCGYHLTILRPNEEIVCGNYLFYALASRHSAYQFYLAANGVTRFGLTYQGTKNVRIAFPPVAEQQQIAAFLDWKTDQIDALIAKKKELLEKLKEKRLAVITQAVTKGLNPAAPLRDSGIPWLGQVPVHWEVIPIKYSLVNPITDGPHETPEILNEGIPFISAEAVKNDKLDFEKKRGFISQVDHDRFSKKYRPQRGDIYMVKSGATTGNVARVETDEDFNIWSPLAALRPDVEMATTDFIFYFMKSKPFFYSVELAWSYGTQQNIGMGVIGNLKMACPPVDEQKVITTHLDGITARFDRMSENAVHAIARLTEYRTALITATTTGKIDVRDVVIPSLT